MFLYVFVVVFFCFVSSPKLLQNRKLLTQRNSPANRAQPPNHQPNTPPHKEPPNHATPDPTPNPTTRPITPEGGTERPLEGRGTNNHRKGTGVSSRPGREEVANPLPKGRWGRTPNLRGWSVNRRQRQTTTQGHDGGGEGNHHPSGRRRGGEGNSFECPFISFLKGEQPRHPKKAEEGSTTQSRRREAAPPKGGGRSQRLGEGTTAQQKEWREKFTSPFWCFFPVPLWVVLIFILSPVGWCRSFFFPSQKTLKKKKKELRSARLAEVKFS